MWHLLATRGSNTYDLVSRVTEFNHINMILMVSDDPTFILGFYAQFFDPLSFSSTCHPLPLPIFLTSPWLPSLDPDGFVQQTLRGREREWSTGQLIVWLFWFEMSGWVTKQKSPLISPSTSACSSDSCCSIKSDLTNVDRLIAGKRCVQTFCPSVKVLDGWQWFCSMCAYSWVDWWVL